MGLCPDGRHTRARSDTGMEVAVSLLPRSLASQLRRLRGASASFVFLDLTDDASDLANTFAAPPPPGHRPTRPPAPPLEHDRAAIFSDRPHVRTRRYADEEVHDVLLDLDHDGWPEMAAAMAGDAVRVDVVVCFIPTAFSAPAAGHGVPVRSHGARRELDTLRARLLQVPVLHIVEIPAGRVTSGSCPSSPAGMGGAIFRFDAADIGVPMGPVVRSKSWELYLGQPMRQQVPGTCTIVACTVCVEARHRMVYETEHGVGTFPFWAASPRKLLGACRRGGIWRTKRGASVDAVLRKIRDSGGIRTTRAPTPAPCFLPLRSWRRHRWDAGAGLGAERVAELLDAHGPCVAGIWVCPWYVLFDDDDDSVVYRGCGRSETWRQMSRMLFGDEVTGHHAVVCFAYQFTGDNQMQVRVMDNMKATGPRRWIDAEEIDTLYTLDVESLDPPKHLGDRPIVYPRSVQK
ncbi:hypothetical protein ACP70R_042105 [Stipagrostis hirtigluma subsp. patula]